MKKRLNRSPFSSIYLRKGLTVKIYVFISIVLILCLVGGTQKLQVKAQSSSQVPGDINNDGRVTIQDLVILSRAYGSNSTSPNWNPLADFDGNGHVNQVDLYTIQEFYGHGIPLILNVSNNLTPGLQSVATDPTNIFKIYANVEYADRCALSYAITYCSFDNGSFPPDFNGTIWINQTMTKNGDSYKGSIDISWMPGQYDDDPNTTIYYRIIAYDSFGFSNMTQTDWFCFPYHK
jgi:hypothetical protein